MLNIVIFDTSVLQAWQLKLIPLEDAPTQGSDKLGAKPSPAHHTPAKEYGCDLPFNQPAPDRTADDVVLALCAGPGANGAAPADKRLNPSTPIHGISNTAPIHVFYGHAPDVNRSHPSINSGYRWYCTC